MTTAAGNAAIYYDPEGFDTSKPKLMGRHAAGEGFIQGFARHANADALYAFTGTRPEYDHFRGMVSAATGAERRTEWLPRNAVERLAEPGGLFVPGPDLETGAWLRRCHDPAAWSLTGVTHTICTHRVMDAIGGLLTAPVEEWDALICTSDAVVRGVQHLLEGHAAYLKERLGATQTTTRAQLPVIPLGVDWQRFQPGKDGAAVRARLRERHRIGDDDICVLFFGRLSYHAKAHPQPMYLALEAAARATKRKIHLVQAGWFATDGIRDAFQDGARALCPSVRTIYVDGRKPEIRERIWLAADIFCSLSDNVQETFGLTPVEAMAAGLPVVASDWDGYRGTVEPGVTGFLVPTAMPPPGAGDEIARRHFADADNYDHYLGNVCQSIAVDTPASTAAFKELIENADLRRRMGEAGRERARSLFDWSVIVRLYQELWTDLAARRAATAAALRGRKPVALRADPFAVFAHYATRMLDAECRVEAAGQDPGERFRRMSRLRMNRIGRQLLASDEDIAALLDRVRRNGASRVADLIQGTEERDRWLLTLGWLAKMDVLRVVP